MTHAGSAHTGRRPPGPPLTVSRRGAKGPQRALAIGGRCVPCERAPVGAPALPLCAAALRRMVAVEGVRRRAWRRTAGGARSYAALSLFLGAQLALCGEYTHSYDVGEEVTLWVNKVGPYHNPQETYLYYSLPFCSTRPVDSLEHRWDGLGEVLEGNDLISSG